MFKDMLESKTTSLLEQNQESSMDEPYFKHMGDVILKDGFTFLDAEAFIWDQMDDAATEGDWSRYSELIQDYDKLEDNYL